jgi:hypothetical protein
MTKPGTEVAVLELPPCSWCDDGTLASVDGATIYGTWANMCNYHFVMYGLGLGIGVGQRLRLVTE